MNKLPPLRIFLGLCLFAAIPGLLRASVAKFAELGDNTYSCTREAPSTFYRDVEKLTEEAKQDAAKYCASKGRQLKLVSVNTEKPWYTLGFPKATVVFKALESGDPELARDEPVLVSTGRTKKTATTVMVAAPATPTTNLYNDLLKLDELRKRGILTDEEFQSEKKKVLERSK